MACTPAAPERRLPLPPGSHLRLALSGPRTCIGIYDAVTSSRRHCAATVPPGTTDAQCAGCAARDGGRALARDAYSDDRDYTLYLAYFGTGLIKVGLTASERGRQRLLEQGALTSTLLAHGTLPVIRAAEKATAAAGLATERLRTSTKTTAWWDLPPAQGRRAALETARRTVETAGMLANATPLPPLIEDHAAAYGLDAPPPPVYGVLTAIAEQAHLALRVHAVAGCILLAEDLDTHADLLIDTRLLAGYRATPSTGPSTGLVTTPRSRPTGDDHDQIGLF